MIPQFTGRIFEWDRERGRFRNRLMVSTNGGPTRIVAPSLTLPAHTTLKLR